MGRWAQANRRGGQLSGYTLPPPTNADWQRSYTATTGDVTSITDGPGHGVDGLRVTLTLASAPFTQVDEWDVAIQDESPGSTLLTHGVEYNFRVRWTVGTAVVSGFSDGKPLGFP